MFYAHIVLAKKGPLARIWLAAHWDKKLTKAHVFETNIEQSVDGIMQPKVKLALRTSGHLLLGVVRIYSRKAKYLLADCNEAFVKIKMAFRPGMVDLPEEHREAAVNAITLPEVFHDFDTALPELNEVDIEAQFSINQSRADEITMREDYGALPMTIHDDGFGDIGFDADGPDFIRDDVDTTIDEHLISEELDLDERTLKEPIAGTSRSMQELDSSQMITDDGFGGSGFGQEPAAGLFEGDLFADAPLPQSTMQQIEHDSEDDLDAGWDMGAHSTASSSVGSRPPTPMQAGPSQMMDIRAPSVTSPTQQQLDDIPHIGEGPEISADDGLPSAAADAVESAHDQEDEHELHDEESFALAPIDASALKGITKTKRKRKLIVDEVKNISGEEMKSQLANTSDIITTLDLAPPTKRLMYWKETGGVEKLFALPSRDIPARELSKNYQRNLTSRSTGVEDFSMLGPADALALDQYQEQPQVILQQPEPAVPGKRGRKRKVQETQAQVPEVRAAELQEESLDVLPPPQTPQMPSPVRESVSHLDGDIPLAYTSNNLSVPSGMTPLHGGMTPVSLHGDYAAAFTPLDHGMMTPQHPSLDQIESIPNLPVDQVSSILNGTEMEGFANMGYDDSHQIGGPGMSERIASDWNDDYDFPPSVVAPQPGDEQMENETDEQFEERVLNKRAAQMFVSVRARLQKQDSIQLSEMTYRNNRKQAAQKFYSLLVLKKFQALEIRQDVAYGDIAVTKGIMFDNPKL
ncbi:double-strand-break repair protein rad21 homolog [Contarinia nasturtii]|uniref:double-strand-break repair protein rad21 homolog n=1 Tax=Contarinia nasturtii TaxID=265458 RepID=UPI0012D3D7E4|nr:double-strand-break repair protein rad21 homolog [Contarinia nasturtii]